MIIIVIDFSFFAPSYGPASLASCVRATDGLIYRNPDPEGGEEKAKVRRWLKSTFLKGPRNAPLLPTTHYETQLNASHFWV